MKSLLLAGAAALGLTFAVGPTTAEAGHCGPYGYGFNSGFGYRGGFGGVGLGYAPVYRSPAFVPVGRSFSYRSFNAPLYPRGFYGNRGFNRRSGVIISTPGFGIRFGY